MDIAKRISLSVLMFIVGTMLLPVPATNLLIGAVQVVLGFAFLLEAIIGLVSSHAAGSLMRIVVALHGAALILLVGVNQLWATLSGRILLVIFTFGLLIMLQVRAAGDE